MATKRQPRPTAAGSSAIERDMLIAQTMLAVAQAQQALAETMRALGPSPAALARDVPSVVPLAHEGQLAFDASGNAMIIESDGTQTVLADQIGLDGGRSIEDKLLRVTFQLTSQDLSNSQLPDNLALLENLNRFLLKRCKAAGDSGSSCWQ